MRFHVKIVVAKKRYRVILKGVASLGLMNQLEND
jgi:hypothetical protein